MIGKMLGGWLIKLGCYIGGWRAIAYWPSEWNTSNGTIKAEHIVLRFVDRA